MSILRFSRLTAPPRSSRPSLGRKPNPSITPFRPRSSRRPFRPSALHVVYTNTRTRARGRARVRLLLIHSGPSSLLLFDCCYYWHFGPRTRSSPPRGNREYSYRHRRRPLLLLLLLLLTTATTTSSCLRIFTFTLSVIRVLVGWQFARTHTHTKTMYYLRCAEKFTQETLYVFEVAVTAGRGPESL